jgi:hypothetical protein
MLTVLLPECAPGGTIARPWILWQFTHAAACCKSSFRQCGHRCGGSAQLARQRQEDRVLLTRVQKWCALKAWVA